MSSDRTLTELRAEFGRSRFLAMPIAGAVAWSAAAAFGATLPSVDSRAIALFICMPTVFPLALLFARFTGEDLFGAKSRNELDNLFVLNLVMCNLVWAIADCPNRPQQIADNHRMHGSGGGQRIWKSTSTPAAP